MEDVKLYNVNNVCNFNKDLLSAYRNGDQESVKAMNSPAVDSKTDYDIFICINKNSNAFVMCVPNVDIIDDPMIHAHFEHSAHPEDIPAVLLVSLFELSADDNVPLQYKLSFRFQLFRDTKGQIKKAYFIGHIRSVSLTGLQCAALDASPKTYKTLSVDNIAFVKHFCREMLKYSLNGRSQEKKIELQLHLVPDAEEKGNICRRLLSTIKDKIATLGGNGIIFVIVVVLIYPILVNWFLL